MTELFTDDVLRQMAAVFALLDGEVLSEPIGDFGETVGCDSSISGSSCKFGERVVCDGSEHTTGEHARQVGGCAMHELTSTLR